MKKVTKAVILVAGQGTRFLPQTKAMPKEMLPLIDKPIIQYVVEEAVAAGITDIIMVTGAHKRSVEDHFDHQYELESQLREKGKSEMADQLSKIADMANFIYLRQKGGKGTGVPILNASHLLDDEPFLVLYGDDIFRGNKPRAVQLVETYEKYQAPVFSLVKIAKEDSIHYGVAGIDKEVEPGILKVNDLVEQPRPEDAPSSYGAVGGYIANRQIIDILENAKPDPVRGELFLPSAIGELSKTQPVYGKVLEGIWHDTGNKEKYLQAVADYALADPQLGPKFADYLRSKL